jgi:hypothetical protein
LLGVGAAIGGVVRADPWPYSWRKAAIGCVRLARQAGRASSLTREHADIELDGSGRWLVRVRNSRYGTFVNEKAITEHGLAHGDRIRLGAAAPPNWCSCSRPPRQWPRWWSLGGP